MYHVTTPDRVIVSGTIPEWAQKLINPLVEIFYRITTCGQMQKRYTELFGKHQAAPIEQTQTTPQPELQLA
jgi:hypothetical protein